MLRAMAKRGVLARIALAFLALLLLAGAAMYVINPFHSPLRDPWARIAGRMLYRQPSLSMAPTIPEGAYFLINTASLRGRDPQPGEIVAFLYPPNPRVTFLKRVVAVGGSTIEIREQQVFVDGKKIAEPYLAGETIYPPEFERLRATIRPPPDLPPFQVPERHFFVLGDNRGFSEDSRAWGAVPRELMVGTFARILFQPTEYANDE